MMKPTPFLNFLNDERRKIIKKTLLLLVFRRIVIVFFVCAIAYSIMLFGIKFYMQKQLTTVTSAIESSTVKKKGATLSVEKAIQDLNKTTQRLDQIQGSYVVWSRTLSRLTALVPEGVSFRKLSINAADKKATLTGTASTRENYANFKKSFETSSFVQEISLPLTLSKADIPFDATCMLKDSIFTNE